jgi:hypothetical protein
MHALASNDLWTKGLRTWGSVGKFLSSMDSCSPVEVQVLMGRIKQPSICYISARSGSCGAEHKEGCEILQVAQGW